MVYVYTNSWVRCRYLDHDKNKMTVIVMNRESLQPSWECYDPRIIEPVHKKCRKEREIVWVCVCSFVPVLRDMNGIQKRSGYCIFKPVFSPLSFKNYGYECELWRLIQKNWVVQLYLSPSFYLCTRNSLKNSL